jgi:hypothetical protein
MQIKEVIIKGGWSIQSTDYDIVLGHNDRHYLNVFDGNNGSESNLPLAEEDLEFAQEIAANFGSHDSRRALALSRLADRLFKERYGV